MTIRRDWVDDDFLINTDLNDTFDAVVDEIDERAGLIGTNGTLNFPIGGIVAFHKSMSGVPTIPSSWVECDGSTISDVSSPMNGQVVPDLNGGNRFLEGSTTSGATGGALTHRHYVNGGGHLAVYNDNGTPVHADGGYTAYADNVPPYMDVVWIMRIK